MSIAVGGNLGKRVGIAPKAKWITCRGRDIYTKIACMQWMLAPTDIFGNFPNSDKRPHISSNSYQCEDCRAEKIVDLFTAVGIVFIKSAGIFI